MELSEEDKGVKKARTVREVNSEGNESVKPRVTEGHWLNILPYLWAWEDVSEENDVLE